MTLDDRLIEKGWRYKSGKYAPVYGTSRNLATVADPAVSIIVISWRLHRDTLTNFTILSGQRDQKFELIFVDNGAQEGEFADLEPFVDTYVRLRTNTGAYLARNIGSLFANAPLLLFLEDDGIPEKDLIRAHLALYEKYDIIACRGPYKPKTDNPLNKLQSHYYIGENDYPTFAHIEGNTSYLARPFFAVGGWDDEIRFGGGGAELYFRLLKIEPDRRKQIYSPGPVIYHDFVKDENHLADKLDKQKRSHDRLRKKYPQWDEIHASFREYSDRSDLVLRSLRRVLFINHAIPPQENSGTPITTLNHAKGLQDQGVQVAILVPTLGEMRAGYEREIRDGLTIYHVPAFDKQKTFLGILDKDSLKLYLAMIAYVAMEFAPDIVHINDYVGMPAGMVALLHDLGFPVVRNVCNDEEICHQDYPVIASGSDGELCPGPDSTVRCASCFLTQFHGMNKGKVPFDKRDGLPEIMARRMEIIRELYREKVDAVVFTSMPFKEHFTAFVPIDEGKIRIIPRGFASSPAKHMERKSKLAGEAIRFAFFGTLMFSKGIDVLFKAFKRVACEGKNFRLDLYGVAVNPEFETWLQHLVEEFPERISFHGAYEPGQFAELAGQIDVAIVPSYFDTYNRVVRECLQYGVPVLCTSFFGAFIVDDGINGLKVPIGDDKALARAMSRVIDEKGLLEHLQAGAQATDIPSLDDEIQSLVRLYESLLFARRMEEAKVPAGNKKSGKMLFPRKQVWSREGNRYLRDIDRFLQSILENGDNLPVACNASLFVNKGEGFTAQDVVRERIARSAAGDFQVSFDLSGFGEILGIRFDPWEGFWGRLRLAEIIAERGAGRPLRLSLARVQSANGVLGLDGFYTFRTCDPIVEVPDLCGQFSVLTIKGTIESFNFYRMEKEWADEKASFAAERISFQDQARALAVSYEERLSQKDQELHGVQQLLTAARIIRMLHADKSLSRPIVLFGAGALAEWVLQLLDNDRFPVRSCFDNRPRAEHLHGIPIQKPLFIPGVLVIIASMYDVEIRKQLRALGFSDADILGLRQ